MTETNIIDAELRELVGKGAARATRRAGRVPCVIYGAKKDPISISISPLELRKNLQSGAFFSTIYDIKIDGASGVERVLAREVQLHPVTDVPRHVDFLRVSAATRVTIEVPCEFINEEECVGLKRGGVLNVVRYAIELLCAVDAIPKAIVVDLAGFDIGDSIHFSHVSVPDGVEPTISDRDFTIATIAAPTLTDTVEDADEDGIDADEGEAASEGEGSAEE
jgi:large subunit ribosomal protein L25